MILQSAGDKSGEKAQLLNETFSLGREGHNVPAPAQKEPLSPRPRQMLGCNEDTISSKISTVSSNGFLQRPPSSGTSNGFSFQFSKAVPFKLDLQGPWKVPAIHTARQEREVNRDEQSDTTSMSLKERDLSPIAKGQTTPPSIERHNSCKDSSQSHGSYDRLTSPQRSSPCPDSASQYHRSSDTEDENTSTATSSESHNDSERAENSQYHPPATTSTLHKERLSRHSPELPTTHGQQREERNAVLTSSENKTNDEVNEPQVHHQDKLRQSSAKQRFVGASNSLHSLINDLHSKFAALYDQWHAAEMEKQSRQFNDAVRVLSSDLKDQKEICQLLEGNKAHLEQLLNCEHIRLNQLSSDALRMRDEINRLQSTAETTNAENCSLQNRIKVIKDSSRDLKSKYRTVAQRRNDLAEELKTTSTKLEAVSEDVEKSQHELIQATAERDALGTVNKMLEQQLEQKVGELTETRNENFRIKENATLSLHPSACLENFVKTIQSSMDSRMTEDRAVSAADRVERATRHDETIKAIEALRISLQAHTELRQQKADAMSDQVDNLISGHESVKNLVQQISTQERCLDPQLKHTIDALVLSIQSNGASANARVSDLQRYCTSLKEEQSAMQDQLLLAETTISDLRLKNQDLRHKFDEANGKLQILESSREGISEANRATEQAREELRIIRSSQDELDRQNLVYRAEKASIQKDLEKAQEDNAQALRALEDSQRALSNQIASKQTSEEEHGIDVASWHRERDELLQTSAAQSASHEITQKELRRCQASAQAQTKCSATLRDLLLEKQQSLSALEERNEEQHREIARLEAMQVQTQYESDQQATLHDQALTVNDELRRRINRLESSWTEACDAIALNLAVEEIREEEQSHDELRYLRASNDDLMAKLGHLEHERNCYQLEIANGDAVVEQMQHDLEQHTISIEQLTTETKDLKEQISLLEISRGNQGAQLARRGAIENQTQQDVCQMVTQPEELGTAHHNLQQKLAERKAMNTQLTVSLADLEKRQSQQRESVMVDSNGHTLATSPMITGVELRSHVGTQTEDQSQTMASPLRRIQNELESLRHRTNSSSHRLATPTHPKPMERQSDMDSEESLAIVAKSQQDSPDLHAPGVLGLHSPPAAPDSVPQTQRSSSPVGNQYSANTKTKRSTVPTHQEEHLQRLEDSRDHEGVDFDFEYEFPTTPIISNGTTKRTKTSAAYRPVFPNLRGKYNKTNQRASNVDESSRSQSALIASDTEESTTPRLQGTNFSHLHHPQPTRRKSMLVADDESQEDELFARPGQLNRPNKRPKLMAGTSARMSPLVTRQRSLGSKDAFNPPVPTSYSQRKLKGKRASQQAQTEYFMREELFSRKI